MNRLLQRSQQMPRETRDTLFSLAVIAWIGLPLVAYLPPWCSAIAAGILIWRALLTLRSRPLPSRRWLWLLLGICMAATYREFHSLLGRDPGVTFVTMLLALKTLEMRARRDAFVVFFLGFFTLLCQLLFSQSLLSAAATLIGLLGLLTALVNSHMPVGHPPLLKAARQALWMALLGAPIMAALFIFFPRVAPLWSVPEDSAHARSGLSNNMRVGSIASLALDSSVAMRIQFVGPPPAPHDLYFRGPVLTRFDGSTWTSRNPSENFADNTPPATVFGQGILYRVTLEASHQPWIAALDATPRSPLLSDFTARRTVDYQWQTDHPIDTTLRFDAHSYPQYRYGPLVWQPTLESALKLPAGYNPRTLKWAADLLQQPRYAHADPPTLIRTVLDLLRSGGYQYTLNPGLYGTHSADEFWFDRKQGFCEHIASAFVVMVRALHLPARIVTGYQGGEINPIDGFWTVRQSDAHAWVEVWLEGQGWVRFDPTAALAPQRIAGDERLQPEPGIFTQAIGAVSPNMLLYWRGNWEALNFRWNSWILNYSQDSQMNLLRKLGWTSPNWQDLVYLLGALVAAASLIGAAWTQWERLQHDPWLRLLGQARRQLQQAGLDCPATAPPRTLAEIVLRSESPHPTELRAISDWLLRLEAWRYARPARATQAALGTLRRQYQQLRWPPRAHPTKK
jgi:transglutaminase-like putative cysteine protease